MLHSRRMPWECKYSLNKVTMIYTLHLVLNDSINTTLLTTTNPYHCLSLEYTAAGWRDAPILYSPLTVKVLPHWLLTTLTIDCLFSILRPGGGVPRFFILPRDTRPWTFCPFFILSIVSVRWSLYDVIHLQYMLRLVWLNHTQRYHGTCKRLKSVISKAVLDCWGDLCIFKTK